MEKTANIRKACEKDIPRLAEILIFTKRMTYRPIFQDDVVSFNIMQVVSLAEELHEPGKLDNVYVYDDGIVRGLVHCSPVSAEDYDNAFQLHEFYVDSFFQNMGIGQKMMDFFLKKGCEAKCERAFLWVLEKNERAKDFYSKAGFTPDGGRKLEEGTAEWLVRYVKEFQI